MPDEPRLVSRVERLYVAETYDDFKAMYTILSPDVRSQASLEDFLRDVGNRDYKVVFWRIRRIQGAPFQETTLSGFRGAAEVSMDVTVEYTNGKREKASDQTDYWVNINDEWYFNWRGWPAD